MSDQIALPRHLFAWLQAHKAIAPSIDELDRNVDTTNVDTGFVQSTNRRVRGRNETILSIEETKALRNGSFYLRVVKRCLKLDIPLPELAEGYRSPNALKVVFTRLCRFLPVKCSKERLEALAPSNDKLLIEILGELETVGTRLERNAKLATHNSISGVTVENNDLDRFHANHAQSLDKPETIGEFLVTSLCTKLLPGVTSEQAAALLGNKDSHLLHKVLTSGVQGSFKPIEDWIFEIHRCIGTFASLFAQATEPDCKGVLQILRSLLHSTDVAVASAGCNLLEALFNDLPDKRVLSRLSWEWLTENHFQALFLCWRSHSNTRNQLARILLWICTSNKRQSYLQVLFEHALVDAFVDAEAYMAFTQDLLSIWLSQGLPLNFDNESGVPYLLEKQQIPELLIQFASNKSSSIFDNKLRTTGLGLLCFLWRHFGNYVEEECPKMAKSMLVLFNKGVRDESEGLVLFSLASMFELLESFVQTHNSCAPLVYKTLIFLLIESHSNKLTREFILVNLMDALRKMPYAPIDILIIPFVKQISLYGFDNYDVEFAILLSRHQNLSIAHGGFDLLDLCGKICLRDATFGKAASYAFIYLIDRFVESSKKVLAYTLDFTNAAVTTLQEDEIPRDLKLSIIAILTNIVQLKHESLNQCLAERFEMARITRPLFDLCRTTRQKQLREGKAAPAIEESPELDETMLAIHSAMVESARPVDCWEDLFSRCGAPCDVTIPFESLQHVLRSAFPGLEMTLQTLPNSRLELLWRNLDPDCTGCVEVNAFLTFMSIFAKRQTAVLSRIQPSAQAIERIKVSEDMKAKSPALTAGKPGFRRFDPKNSSKKSSKQDELSLSVDHQILTCKKRLKKGFTMLDAHSRYVLSKLDLLNALKDPSCGFHQLIAGCPCSRILLKTNIVDELRRLRTRNAGYITQVELIDFVVFHVKAERIKEKRKSHIMDEADVGIEPAKLKVQRDIRTAKKRFETKALAEQKEEERLKLKSRERRRKMRKLFAKIKETRWTTLTSGSSLEAGPHHRKLPCEMATLREYLQAFQPYVNVLEGAFIKYTKAVIPRGISFDEIDDGQTAMSLAGWLRLSRFFHLVPMLFDQSQASSYYYRALAYATSSRKMQFKEFFIALSLIAHTSPRFRYHDEASTRIQALMDFMRTALRQQICGKDHSLLDGKNLINQWRRLKDVPCYVKTVQGNVVTAKGVTEDKAESIRISLEILDGVIESALEMDFLIETPTKAVNWNKAKAEPKGKTVVQPFNAGRVPPGMAKLMKCKLDQRKAKEAGIKDEETRRKEKQRRKRIEELKVILPKMREQKEKERALQAAEECKRKEEASRLAERREKMKLEERARRKKLLQAHLEKKLVEAKAAEDEAERLVKERQRKSRQGIRRRQEKLTEEDRYQRALAREKAGRLVKQERHLEKQKMEIKIEKAEKDLEMRLKEKELVRQSVLEEKKKTHDEREAKVAERFRKEKEAVAEKKRILEEESKMKLKVAEEQLKKKQEQDLKKKDMAKTKTEAIDRAIREFEKKAEKELADLRADLGEQTPATDA